MLIQNFPFQNWNGEVGKLVGCEAGDKEHGSTESDGANMKNKEQVTQV